MDLNNVLFSSDDDDSDGDNNRRVYKPRINFQVPNDFQFKEKFRLRRTEVQFLLDRIGQHLRIPQRHYSLTPKEQILLTLHWMGTGTYYHAVGDMHGPSKSFVCLVVKNVVSAIVDHLFQEVVRWPDNTDDIAPEFLRKGGFPCVAGCVDGTLIKIDAPSVNEEQYVDRNGNHSINAMVVCGADFSFYAVNSRWPGSVHDSRVLRTSAISRQFENGWRPFPGAVILGDSGYGLKEWLIPPYPHNNTIGEVRFNRAHKSTRRLVENAIGILKERFPTLNYMRLNPEYAGRVVMACSALHNIASKDDFDPPPGNNDAPYDGNDDGQSVSHRGRVRVQDLLNYFN